MKNKFSILKSIVAAVALAASVSGVARAADNDTNPLNGESYEYFKNAQATSDHGPSNRQLDIRQRPRDRTALECSRGAPGLIRATETVNGR